MILTHEKLFEIIKEAETEGDIANISPDIDLKEIGIDSLEIMNIFLDIQEATGVEVSDDEMNNLNTVRKICDYVNVKI